MDNFLDGKPPFLEAFGNPDSQDDIRRIAGILKDSRKQIKLSGVLTGENLPDLHFVSLSCAIGVIFRDTVNLCEEIGDLSESKSEAERDANLRKIVIWAQNEIGSLILTGKRITDGQAAILERNLPHSAIMDGVRNSIFFESDPVAARKYLLERDEPIQVPSEQDVIRIIYEVAQSKAGDSGRYFYQKLLIDPATDPTIEVDLGQGPENLRLRQIMAYYIFRNHAATRLRTMKEEFIKQHADTVIDFIGRPHRDMNKVIRKIGISLMAMSSPSVAGALQDCYHKARQAKSNP